MSEDLRDIARANGVPEEYWPLISAMYQLIKRVAEEREGVAATRASLGPDVLIPYGDFLRANDFSYELGKRFQKEGRLKVLKAGGKLVVRRGHAEEFVRKLPLAK